MLYVTVMIPEIKLADERLFVFDATRSVVGKNSKSWPAKKKQSGHIEEISMEESSIGGRLNGEFFTGTRKRVST